MATDGFQARNSTVRGGQSHFHGERRFFITPISSAAKIGTVPRERLRRGFTLVELLVVITIIGILIGLLLPAVQSARESARRLQCANNLKQLSMAFLLHEQAQGFFPTGGWGVDWLGVPERGFGVEQPGGWAYNTLPYIEQGTLRDAALGKTGAARLQAGMQTVQTPLTIHHCPSRRRPRALPFTNSRPVVPTDLYNVSSGTLVSKGDYAVPIGDSVNTSPRVGGNSPRPLTLDEGDAPSFSWHELDVDDITGISYPRSRIEVAMIRDGTSNTYMLGEKYMRPEDYSTGVGAGDDQCLISSNNTDNMRSTNPLIGPPMQDRLDILGDQRFGSAHAGACNFAFCDGSVRTISYSISAEVHSRLGDRRDGKVLDGSQF